MKIRTFMLTALLSGYTVAIQAAEQIIAPVIVSASQYDYQDTEAPYASEVYSREAISESGAVNLYDFLKNNTSITVQPSYGNSFSQKIDMRGYGIGDGYQNIVVAVDGHRLNNIDMVPQLLSSLPLEAIDHIEIVKGSGSVINGDGAMAGVINIYTRDHNKVSAKASAGNYGVTSSSLYAGVTEGMASLNVSTENYHQDGFSDKDITGHRDEANSNNMQANLKLYPTDALELRVGGSRSRIDTTYPGSLTKQEFDKDPAQNGGNTYTRQKYNTDNTRFGATYDLSPVWQMAINHLDEDKSSEYISPSWNNTYNYNYTENNLVIKYKTAHVALTAGMDQFDGERVESDSRTQKNNSATYLQGHYFMDATTLSAGVRREKVEYTYKPNAGSNLTDSRNLTAYDIGLNQRINDQLTLFTNYNSAYQAPDIDRFFNWGGTFNTFIKPAKSRTLNIGMNRLQENNKLKLTLFYSWLNNEIYYNTLTYTNTNIDKSHKYGMELQDTWHISDQWSTGVNYAYTRAIIDKEDSGSGAYDGKDLPGVSNHTATLSLNYRPSERSNIALSHTYRSEAYAADDFANNFEQKQAAYNSTDLGYNYRIRNMKLFARVENLFGNKNGMWIRDDSIYPVNFTTNWRFGVSADF